MHIYIYTYMHVRSLHVCRQGVTHHVNLSNLLKLLSMRTSLYIMANRDHQSRILQTATIKAKFFSPLHPCFRLLLARECTNQFGRRFQTCYTKSVSEQSPSGRCRDPDTPFGYASPVCLNTLPRLVSPPQQKSSGLWQDREEVERRTHGNLNRKTLCTCPRLNEKINGGRSVRVPPHIIAAASVHGDSATSRCLIPWHPTHIVRGFRLQRRHLVDTTPLHAVGHAHGTMYAIPNAFVYVNIRALYINIIDSCPFLCLHLFFQYTENCAGA